MPQREILCIDDDVQSLEIRKILLETFDFRVLTTTSPAQGLKLFRSHNIQAVVLDYQMPEMNGGEVAQKMKSLRPQVPVVVLSAMPWLPQDAPRECIDAFFTKGGPTSKLVTELEYLIEAAPSSPAKAQMHAARSAGALLGVVAARIRGVSKTKASTATEDMSTVPARVG